MAPFLYTGISQVIVSISEKFIRAEKLGVSVCLNLEHVEYLDNHLPAKSVVLGFDTKRALKDAKVKELDALNFYSECRTCLKTIVVKLLTRSPITYPLTKALSCLDPSLIAANTTIAKRRLEKLLTIMIECGRITGRKGDLAASQYRAVITKTVFIDSFKNYNRSVTRLDHFWRDILGVTSSDLLDIIKMVCCLSHGNANVERGFSVNAGCLFENMQEESVVARRQVYDAVTQMGGLDKFDITKTLLLRARNAHSLYIEDLHRKKKEATETAALAAVKRKHAAEVRELELKRKKLLEDAQNEA